MTDYSLLNKTFTPKTTIKLQSQRVSKTLTFEHGISLQLEGLPNANGKVVVRGKYPNDEWWGTVNFSDLEEL